MATKNGNGRIVVGARHPVTLALIEAYKDSKPGDIIMADHANNVAGCGIRVGNPGRGYLMTAIRVLLKEYGVVLKWQARADCLKCLAANEIRMWSANTRRHVTRQSHRIVTALRTCRLESMRPEDAKEHLTEAAMVATLGVVASGDMRRRLVLAPPTEPPSLIRMLEAITQKADEK